MLWLAKLGRELCSSLLWLVACGLAADLICGKRLRVLSLSTVLVFVCSSMVSSVSRVYARLGARVARLK